ncbi:TPA: hypothetical protein RFV54_003718 [Klebsiella aerogenes]|nr:hypothetical protein [Klebsiella aerogenes]
MDKQTSKLMLDSNGKPTFEKNYNAMLQRISLKTMSLADIQAYCVMKSRYDFFKSLNDKAVLRENVEHLAKRCHLGRKAMNNALDTLISLGLITDLTPDLRNKPHCYVVHNWELREDLLTESTIEEDRKDFFIWENESTVPKEQSTMPKGTVECAKGTVECSKGHMSKTDLHTDSHTDYKTIKDNIKEVVEEVIENEIEHVPMTPTLEPPSTVSLFSQCITNSVDKYHISPDKEKKFMEDIELSRQQNMTAEDVGF